MSNIFILRIFAVTIFVFTTFPVFANQPDYAAISAALTQLNGTDHHAASQGAKDLANYPYIEVASSLIKRLQGEVTSTKPNSHIIQACIASLDKMASSSDTTVLTQILGTFNTNHANLTWARHVVNSLQTLIVKASSNRKVLPPLPIIQGGAAAKNQAPVAAASSNSGSPGQKKPTFKDELQSRSSSKAAAIVLQGSSRFLGDEERENRANGKNRTVLYRDDEADRTIDILIRIRGKFPVLIGLAGVGKTTIVERINQKIIDKDFPQTATYQKHLQDAEVIETSASKISSMAKSNDNNSQAEAMRVFMEAVIELEKEIGRPLIIYIDEMHMLQQPQIEALLTFLDSRTQSVRIIGSTNSEKLEMMIKRNEAFKRRKEDVPVVEFTEQQTKDLIRNSTGKEIENEYNVVISDEAIEAAVRQAPSARPDNRRPEGPYKLLQDVAIALHRKNKGANVTLNDTDIYDMVKKITGMPVNPHDTREFDAFIEDVKKRVKSQVKGRDKVIDRIFDTHITDLLVSDSRRPKVLVDIGTTGTGKSHLGEQIAVQLFRNKSHFFEIDGTAFQSGGFADNSLFGAPNGVISSDQTSGTLMEWLDDPSRGKFGGVIVINEAEKMDPSVWKRFMEFFDKGQIPGGDGRHRFSNRHIVILTSNRGAKLVFPDAAENWTEKEIDQRVENMTSEQLKKYFTSATGGKDDFRLPPEVVGRVDEFIVSRPSTPGTAVEVGRLVADYKIEQFKEKYGITLTISDKLVEFLALSRWNINDGNRPVKRAVEEFIAKSFSAARRAWNLSKNSKANLDLYIPHPGAQAQIQITTDNQKPIFISAPQKKIDNPFLDKELISQLQNLPNVMKAQVIGQDQAIESLVQSIWAQRMNKLRRPISMFVVGPTGLGKTELGRALANGLYGASERVGILSLGDVANEIDFNMKMGPPPGIMGSDQQWEFEKLLAANPEGGVILFDEASNMGGADKAQKTALFKRLYHIVEEGTWQSPANSSLVYDLRKYVFIFTGNDAEVLFQGLTDDDMRLATWKQNKSRDKVRALLLEAGVPEAFIGRMCDLILMKPLIKPEQILVAEKIIRIETGKFQKNYPTVKIKYDEKFVAQVAESFFTHDKGGRSVRDIAEQRLAALISMLMVEAGVQPTADQGEVEVELSLSDNLGKKPFIRKSFTRKVELGASVKQNGKYLGTKSFDLAEFANSRPLFGPEEAKSFAFHEVGHALMNDPRVTGHQLAFVTIYGGKAKDVNYLGYARYEPVENSVVSPTKDSVLFEMAGLYAGSLAEELAGYKKSAGWSNDLEKMKMLAERYLINFGFSEKYLGVRLDEHKKPILSGHLAAELEKDKNQLIEKARLIAEDILKDNWFFVRSAVAELLQKGNMSGKRFEEIGTWVTSKESKGKSTRRSYEEYMARQKPKTMAETMSPMISRVAERFNSLMSRPSPDICRGLFQ